MPILPGSVRPRRAPRWLNLIRSSLATSLVSARAAALLAGWLRQFVQPGRGASAAGPAGTGVIVVLEGTVMS
jgi:hypothetical protein